jgi:hypothetical protein
VERRRLHEIAWTLKRNGNGIDLTPTLYHPTMLPQIIGSQPLVMLSPACFGCRYCPAQGFSPSGAHSLIQNVNFIVS